MSGISNLEIVKKIYALYNERNPAATFEYFERQVLIYQTAALPWGSEYEGLDGLTEFLKRLTASLDSTVVMSELIPAGEAVVAVGRTSGRVKKTGVEFDVPAVHIWKFSPDGKILKFDAYIDTPAMTAALSSSS